jgi:hypothetical protein
MKHAEYIEGPEATENFKQFATAILQAPTKKKKKQTKKSASQKSKQARLDMKKHHERDYPE